MFVFCAPKLLAVGRSSVTEINLKSLIKEIENKKKKEFFI
jgi:hypothetical protein